MTADSSPKRYPCATLAEIAAIPEEAQARVVAEIPAMLRTIRDIRAAAPQLAAEMRAKAPWPWRILPASFFRACIEVSAGRRMIWVDDDKGLATVSMGVRNGDTPFYSRTQPHTPDGPSEEPSNA